MSNRIIRAAVPVALSVVLLSGSALAQDASSTVHIPQILVTGTGEPSLTVPSTEGARREIEQTPGAVEVVPDTAFKDGPANTIRDIVGWVPGVIAQPKSNTDNRISIRGSGLTRNYGNRGVNLYLDGVPVNSSDGLTDVFEIDPSAYRYVEVYKGANALRYGGNALGGAINFVMPSGRDASRFDGRIDGGSFGFVRGQASTGGVSGPFDYFINLSAQREDGFRDHSNGHIIRGNTNFGYQFSPDAETRFYINANTWRQRLPGELTKSVAMNSPRSADPAFVQGDQQRNIDSLRVANKTTLRFGPTTLDFGVFTHQRHVDHPIFRYLDYRVSDYGGFTRVTDDRIVGGFRNRFVAGANVLVGTSDYTEHVNIGGAVKGALTRSEMQKAGNYSAFFENGFYFLPNVAFIIGGQYAHVVRDRADRFLANGDQSAKRTYDLFSPKVGLLWDVAPDAQIFANISRSAEAPTFDSLTFTTFAGALPDVKAQTATTYEIGTRGRRSDFTWDLALYRTELRNEFQCLAGAGTCSVVNADRTVHQGVELGLGLAVLKSMAVQEDRLWFNLAYTFSDFRFNNDAMWGNNRLPGVPPHQIRAELLYKHPNGFYAGPNVEWTPRAFYADNANSLTVDPYALLNFRMGFDKESGWSAYLEGRNLLDTRYISATIITTTANAASALFSPGYGRALYGGLRARW